jgi:hypothetical protein
MGWDWYYVPPLLEAYLRGGAWIAGEPAWDADDHCAELFLLLPVDALHRRPATTLDTQRWGPPPGWGTPAFHGRTGIAK